MKLKNEASWEYRVLLVVRLVSGLIRLRKERISSGVKELKSLSPNWVVSLERIDW
jgi:hypothetical protein